LGRPGIVHHPSSIVHRLGSLLSRAIADNPSTLFDCHLFADTPPEPGALRDWRAALPYQPGYLDRVAVYRRAAPEPGHERVSPRLWLVLPWIAQAAPEAYQGIAAIIWTYDMAVGEAPPFEAWAAAGGAGCGCAARRRSRSSSGKRRLNNAYGSITYLTSPSERNER